MNGPILNGKELRTEYGGIVPVQDVSLEVGRAVLRADRSNGAGKRSNHLISGLVSATAGRIEFLGENATEYPARRMARLGMARTFQITSIFPTHTVYESLRAAVLSRTGLRDAMKSAVVRRAAGQRADEIIEQLNLGSVRDIQAANLSYGDQRVLEFGIALAREPKLLLLDEPTAGMSLAETGRLVEIVKGLKGSLAVLIVEHDMEVVMELADRICVLDRGQIIADGTPVEIAANPQVQAIYLGAP